MMMLFMVATAVVTLVGLALILFILQDELSALQRGFIGLIGGGMILTTLELIITGSSREGWPFVIARLGVLGYFAETYTPKLKAELMRRWSNAPPAVDADLWDTLKALSRRPDPYAPQKPEDQR